MKMLLLFFFGITMFLMFFYLFHSLLLTDRRLRKRMQLYLQTSAEKKRPLERAKIDLFVQMERYKRAVKEKALSKKGRDRLEEALSRAGLPLKPEEFVMFQWISMALCAGILYIIWAHWVFALIGLAVGWALPRWFLGKRQRDRLQAFNDGLPDMITTLVSSLRAGFSFAQSLKSVVDEADEPVRGEIDQVLKEMQYGSSMEAALFSLKERVPSEDLELMIQAIIIQRQVGGNLATILETIVGTIRERNKIQRQVKTLTAQGKLSGIVIGSLPLALGAVIYMMEPGHIGVLFTHPAGIGMVVAGSVSGLIGFVLIRKVTTIEV